MSTMNYTTLTAGKTTEGSIQRWVNNDTVPAADIIRYAENFLARRVRVKRMQARTNPALSLATGNSEIDLSVQVPAFLDPIRLWNVTDNCKVTFVHEDEIDQLRGYETDGSVSEGYPSSWTVVAKKILFDAKADETYSLILTHYAQPTALASGNQTNLWTTDYPELFEDVLIARAYVFLKDERRAADLLGFAEAAIAKINETDDLVRRGQEFDVETV